MKTYKLHPPQLGEFTATNMPVPPGYVQSLVNFIAVPGGAQGWGSWDSSGDITDYAGHFYSILGTSAYEITFTRNSSGVVRALFGNLTTGVYIEQAADRMKDGLYPREYLVHDGLIYICGSDSRPYLAGVRQMGYDPVTDPVLAPAGEAPYNVRGSAGVCRVPLVESTAVKVGEQDVIASGNQHNVTPLVQYDDSAGIDAAAYPVMDLDGIVIDTPGSGYTNNLTYAWRIKAGTWNYGINDVAAGTDLAWDPTDPLEVVPDGVTPAASDVGRCLRIVSGTNYVAGEYVITGVSGGAWTLEVQPSFHGSALTDGVWELHDGPGSVLGSGTAASVDATVNTRINPNNGYNVSAADIGRKIYFLSGAGWSTIPCTITGINGNQWVVNASPAATGTTGGTWVIRGTDVARDALGYLQVTGGKVTNIVVTDNGKYINMPAPTNNLEVYDSPSYGGTVAQYATGSGATFIARLKVRGIYTYAGGTGYTGATRAYVVSNTNNGPRASEGGTGPLTGRYEYAVTYRYKESAGQILYESGLSESFWSVKLAASKAAKLQGLGKGSLWTSGMWANDNDYDLRPFPTHLVVYRRGGNVGVFRETMEIPWEALDSGRIYVDSKADADLGSICPTAGTMPPPTGARFVQHHARRMWYAVGDTLYASKQDEPWVCSNDSNPTLLTAPMRFTIEEGMDITGLVSVDRVLIVFTNNSAYRIDGTSAQDFRLSKIEAPGCNLYHSAREYRDGVIWHAPAGVYYWRNGYGVENVGLPIGSQAASGTCRSAVFTHQGVEMYLLSTGDSYMRLFSGSGWSSITRPASGVVDIVGLPASVVGGTTISLRVMTVSTGNGKIHQWPSTTAGGFGRIIWPMQEFGDIGHVKSILATRAMVQGLTTSSTLGCRVDYYSSSELFTGTTQTATASAYGNHLIHFRNRGVYGYQIQPALHVTTTNTRLRVHGIEMDVVTRGLARG